MAGQGGRGGYKLPTGCSWDSFEESAKDHESHGRAGSSRNPLSPTAGRLCKEDMAIYGEDPAMDSLSLVVCRQCERVVKSQAYQKHKRLYHSELLKIPAPKRLNPHTHHQPSPIPGSIHTVGQPSNSVGPGEAYADEEGGAKVMGFTASNLPIAALSTVPPAPGLKSSKEYDANRHCGVWLDDEQKPCTRSLTCKIHPLNLRRKVAGRSRPFNELLELHKKRKKWKKQGRQNSEVGLPPPQLASPLQSPIISSSRVPHQPSLDAASPPLESPASASPTAVLWDPQSEVEPGDSREDLLYSSFPRPLAVCSFGTRSTVLGSLVFSRRFDSLRSGLANLVGKTKDYTATTLHRKHSYNSLLTQTPERSVQRKYYKKRSDLERPTSFVSTSTPHEPHNLPATLKSPPPTSTHPLVPAVIPKQPELRSLFPASQFYPNTGTSPPSPSNPPATHSRKDSLTAASPPVTQEAGKPKKTTKKSKSKRGRRAKHQSSDSQRDKNNRIAASSNEQNSDTTTTASTGLAGQAPVTPVSETSQVGFLSSNSPTTLSVAPSLLERRAASNTSVTNSGMGVVTIKQEPLTNHEEMEVQTGEDDNSQQNQQFFKLGNKSTILNGMVTPTTHPGINPTIHSFNSINSPQTFVINPTGQHPTSSHPMVTSLSPHMSGIVPIGGSLGSMAQNPSVSPSHQQQQQQTFAFNQTLQPTSSPLHLPSLRVHMLPEQLQRHMLQQSQLFTAAASNSLFQHQQEAGIHNRRVFLGQQQQQQQQQQQREILSSPTLPPSSLAMRTVSGATSLPSLHPGTLSSVSRTPPRAPIPMQNPPKFQLAVSGSSLATKHRTSTGSKVRAPISQIPTGSHFPDSLQRTVPPGGTPNVINQSPFQSKQNLTPRAHLPSQQVT